MKLKRKDYEKAKQRINIAVATKELLVVIITVIWAKVEVTSFVPNLYGYLTIITIAALLLAAVTAFEHEHKLRLRQLERGVIA